MSKAIFLDFDGVLNSEWSLKIHNKLILALEHIAILNCIITRTGAAIVVSSTWRLDMSLRELKGMLTKKGVAGRVVGKTPDSYRLNKEGISIGRERGCEIQAWLTEHPSYEKFCIIDDEDDMLHLKPYLVQTNFATGLQEEHIEPAVALLGEV